MSWDNEAECICKGKWGVTLHDDPIGTPVTNDRMILQTDYVFETWEAAARFAYTALAAKAGLPYNSGGDGATVALLEKCCLHLYDTTWMVRRRQR